MPQISRRTENLGTENAFVVLAEVNELVRQGRDIISFCIGQPDFHTPVNVQDAAVRAVRARSTSPAVVRIPARMARAEMVAPAT